MRRTCLKGVRHLLHRKHSADRKREASSAYARHRVSARRPPARPTGRGPRKTLEARTSAGKNLKNSTRQSARQAETTRARCGGGLGCAGRVDAPEGIGRQSPKATTTMTTGQSGAKAPDRNRSPARPRPPLRRASKEPAPLAAKPGVKRAGPARRQAGRQKKERNYPQKGRP